MAGFGLLHRSQHPVLHAQVAVVLAEQQPVAGREGTLALGGLVGLLVRKLAPFLAGGANCILEGRAADGSGLCRALASSLA